jgi:hypothetical protein
MELILGLILFTIGMVVGTYLPLLIRTSLSFWFSFLAFALLIYSTRIEGLEQIFPLILIMILTLMLVYCIYLLCCSDKLF